MFLICSDFFDNSSLYVLINYVLIKKKECRAYEKHAPLIAISSWSFLGVGGVLI